MDGDIAMKIFKTATDRLVRYFEKSRDTWKARALQKQQQLRALEIKVRDLSVSRDDWKKTAKEAEKAQRETSKKEPSSRKSELNKTGEDNLNSPKESVALTEDKVIEGELIKSNKWVPVLEKNNPMLLPLAHPTYPLFIIQLAVQQVIYAGLSLRGCERHFELLTQFFHLPTPCVSSIRQWVLRIGLYILQIGHECRSDWIMIVDMTIELGTAKCLVILGIPQAHLPSAKAGRDRLEDIDNNSFVLQHQRVKILSIEVLTTVTGEVINDKLEALSKKVGIPRQIIADQGSDVKKGIELFRQKHKDTIYTCDSTHQLALFLKQHLKENEPSLSGASKCSTTAKELQQTALHFLKPPTQRTKARWLNVAAPIDWAQRLLAYQAAGDFSVIDPTYGFDGKAYQLLLDTVDHESRKLVVNLLEGEVIYPDRASFSRAVRTCIGEEVFAQYGGVICETADQGRRYFQEKLGWLAPYKDEIASEAEMIELVQTAQPQVKQQGLSQTARMDFENSIKAKGLTAPAEHLKAQIIGYLTQEGGKIPDGEILLGTADIIESIFGKYKQYMANSPLKEVGKMILTIPLCVTKITSQLVKEAMEYVSTIDVKEWADQVFGSSALSKRREAFRLKKRDIKVA
jgi:hypothetical protein